MEATIDFVESVNNMFRAITNLPKPEHLPEYYCEECYEYDGRKVEIEVESQVWDDKIIRPTYDSEPEQKLIAEDMKCPYCGHTKRIYK
jgi:rubrerythrin